jgi:hypothetical protein
MYSVAEVLRNIDAQPATIAAWAAFAMLVGYVQCIESIRLGFRDKTHAMPIAAVTYFFAHDSLYALGYFTGHGVSDHWFFAWGGWIILPYTVLELILSWQIITYSRKELGLGDTWLKAFFSYLGILGAMYVFHLFTRVAMDDPLYLTTTLLSLFMSQAFMIPLVLRRKSRKGQSVILAATLCIGFGLAHAFYYPLLAEFFRSPIVLLAGATSTAVAAVYLWLVIKAPRYTPESEHGGSATRASGQGMAPAVA